MHEWNDGINNASNKNSIHYVFTNFDLGHCLLTEVLQNNMHIPELTCHVHVKECCDRVSRFVFV